MFLTYQGENKKGWEQKEMGKGRHIIRAVANAAVL
jgi:hypothetical protein